MKTAAGAARLTEITCNYVTQPESSWQLVTSVTRVAWLRSWLCFDPRLPVVKKLSGSGLETSETLTRGLWPLSWCLRDTCDKWPGHWSWHCHVSRSWQHDTDPTLDTWVVRPGVTSSKECPVSSPGTSANQKAGPCPAGQSEGGRVSCDTGGPGLDKGQLIICIQTRSDSGYQARTLTSGHGSQAPESGVPDTSEPVQHKSNKILNVYWDQAQ